MKSIFKTFVYLILAPIAVYITYILFALIVGFSYTRNILSWIPYILLGGWAPGKWYGLTLVHSILCVAISFEVIGFFDKRLEIADRARFIILVLNSLGFLYGSVSDFFFQNGDEVELFQLRQMALLQFSFLIGIVTKTANKDAVMGW